MLDANELAETAAAFGVSDTQVRRDHLISHILVAVADLALPVIFFGGTALARTHLSDPSVGARLSEDIDLYTPQRRATAVVLDEQLPQRLRREFPGTRWDPALSAVRWRTPASWSPATACGSASSCWIPAVSTKTSLNGQRRTEP